jgi:3-oxoacyl-[acyl-carrier-protein] synthase II
MPHIASTLTSPPGAVPCTVLTRAPSGWVHPTINMSTPDDGVDPKLVCAGEKQQHDVKVALSNSFGFGGHNSCIIFKKF